MKYVKIYTDFALDIEDLGYAERGRLFTAMLEYAGDGTIPSLVGNERYLWNTAKKLIDAQRESYEHRCAVNKVVATNRYESLRNVTKRNESWQEQEQEQKQEQEYKKKYKWRFTPPSLQEVSEYAKEKGYEVDINEFYDYYANENWRDSKGQPVKNWKGRLATWVKKSYPRRRTGANANYEQRAVNDEDFADLFLDLG